MASDGQPRKCTVTKQEGKGFGFYLRIEKDEDGHLVRAIEAGSAAEKAGLKDGDRLLRVNGTFVDSTEHAEVVSLIKESGTSVTLEVLDKTSYENAKKKGDDLSQLNHDSKQEPESKLPAKQPTVHGDKAQTPRPRLCYLAREGNVSYGFSLKTTKGTSGIFMSNLTPDSIAVKAGIKENDRIIEVNGKNVERATHDQLAKKVKDSGNNVMFLLADKETDEHYKNQKMEITADKATLRLLPSKPRIVALKKNANGYGFFLRQEKNHRGHYTMDIDAGSPAEKAQLQDYDRIVAVNGECVEQNEHEEVVEAIRKGGEKTTLLIVDKNTDELYTKAGISPYLYLQEVQDETKKDLAPTVAATLEISPDQPKTTSPAAEPVKTQVVISAVPVPDPKHKPRLCRLQKGTNGYGFHLNAIKEIPGQYLKQVVKGGAADVAGVKEDDVLLEVNGVNVEKESYEDVVMRIKDAKGNVTLLVASQEAYHYFKEQNMPITASMADPLPVSEALPCSTVSTPASKARAAPEPIELQSNQTEDQTEDQTKEGEDDDTCL